MANFFKNPVMSQYYGGMGPIDMDLIENMCGFIFISMAAGFVFEVRIENKHVWQFGELGRTRQTTR